MVSANPMKDPPSSDIYHVIAIQQNQELHTEPISLTIEWYHTQSIFPVLTNTCKKGHFLI